MWVGNMPVGAGAGTSGGLVGASAASALANASGTSGCVPPSGIAGPEHASNPSDANPRLARSFTRSVAPAGDRTNRPADQRLLDPVQPEHPDVVERMGPRRD